MPDDKFEKARQEWRLTAYTKCPTKDDAYEDGWTAALASQREEVEGLLTKAAEMEMAIVALKSLMGCGHPKGCWVEDSSELEYIDGIPVARVGGYPAHCIACNGAAAAYAKGASDMREKAIDVVKKESNFASFHAVVCDRIHALPISATPQPRDLGKPVKDLIAVANKCLTSGNNGWTLSPSIARELAACIDELEGVK